MPETPADNTSTPIKSNPEWKSQYILLSLPLKDRPALMGAAAKRGYILTLAEEEHALEAKDALMSELAANE